MPFVFYRHEGVHIEAFLVSFVARICIAYWDLLDFGKLLWLFLLLFLYFWGLLLHVADSKSSRESRFLLYLTGKFAIKNVLL